MAAYTDKLGFTKNAAAVPAHGHIRGGFIQVELDFAKIAAARAAAGVPALAGTDTLEILRLPADSLVIAAGADVTDAEGGTATIGLGDAASATRYLTALNLNSVAKTASTLDSPFLIAAETGILATFNHANIDAARVVLWFVVLDVTFAR